MTASNILTWMDPEWYDPKDGDYDEAYAASDPDYFVECEVTHRPGDDLWFWLVKATSNLSEYPEVQDAGRAPTADAGKQHCEDHVRKLLATNPVKKTY